MERGTPIAGAETLWSRRDFVRMGAMLTVGASAASLLAACGGDSTSGGSSGDDSGGSASQTPATSESTPASSSESSSSGEGVVLNVAVVEEPPSLEPHNLTAAAAGLIGNVVMPGLVWWDYDLGVSPQIAEKWETSADGTEWTFTLRDGVTFHNGKPCTAGEILRNFEHIKDPNSGSMLTPDFEDVEVFAPDDKTVVFTLTESFAPFLAILSHRVAMTDMDAYDGTKPIGTGPFKIVEWQRGSQIILERHEGYWEEGLPKADRVNWKFMPDSDVRLTALRAGEVDITTSVPTQIIDQIKESGEFVVDPIPGVGEYYLAFNCAEGPFADVRMRKAVAHAIDKEAILEVALWGHGTITNVSFPPTSPWFVEIPDYEQDKDKARALVEEAGYGGGLELDMPIPNWSPSAEVAEIVQADLADIGIDVRLVEIEWATYWPEIYLKSDFYITYMGYSARIDPDQIFYPRFHSKGVHNATRYSNPRVDELIEQGRREIEEAKRKEIYAEVQRILVDELPWLWLYLPDITNGWAKNVVGFRQHPGDLLFLTEATKQ
ncbi:extracellular solute-binding protein family 5 [Sphaerobacter thermophilus DSM 20745]|uniref:Extracellular solute-binding protein family 5 n=2 Tax=Sphaerobacter TaxID=2056 RepID=D1C2E2_SPHTD|nr:extracellular solute-binding protein family 5 [Sphaerobacter thermophilus DSM 20745]